jgi:membrane-associated phospholipid phosphatase
VSVNSAVPQSVNKQHTPNAGAEESVLRQLRTRLIEMYTQDPMRRFNRLIACVSAFLIITVIALLPVAQLRISIFLVTLPAPLLIGAFAVWSQVVSCPRLRDAFLLCFWALLITVCIGSLVWAAARTPIALVDLRLAHFDHSIGLETDMAVQAALFHPRVAKILAAIYSWMIPFSLAALIISVFEGKREPAQRLVIAYAVAALTTIVVFALYPAAGPWTIYPFKASADQLLVQSTLAMLKTSGPLRQNIAHCGLVAFPSFHVAQCILTAIALWHSRWLRFPAAVLAMLMCISTVTTGWHYVIDVIGGATVAIFSQVIAVWVFRQWVQTKPVVAREPS